MRIHADPDPEGADPQFCPDCLILLLQHLVLVGHSMGGAVAVAAAQLEAGIAGQISGILILNSSVVDPDPDLMGSLDPYPDPDSQSGSGRAKLPSKIKKMIKFHFLKCWMFSCSLDVLYGGLEISCNF
jgi:pimeloyl-ACP methyl ester carboxylesterase